MRLDKAVELFLGEYEQKPSTKKAYFYVMRGMAEHIGPSRDVKSITPRQVVEYDHVIKNNGYAAATIRKHQKTIKTFFNWLVRLEEIPRSPAGAMKAKKLPAYISRDKAMSDEEFMRLLDYVKWKPRDYALVLFLADTGCRAIGASGLKVDDLDLDLGHAYVTEKFDKTRPVAFGEVCKIALETWLKKRKPDAGPYVFNIAGHQIKPPNISQIVTRACIKTGIRPLGSHSLRHRKGHQFADAKVAPSIAATALGHSDPTITIQHYYPADWETAEKELKKLAVHVAPDKRKLIKLS